MKVPEPRKLKSGTWFIQLRLNGVSVPVSGRTRKECVDTAAVIKAEHRAGQAAQRQSAGSLTVGQAIDARIERLRPVLSPATVRGYKTIRNNRFPGIMDKKPAAVKDWQAVINQEAGKVTAKTLKNSWALVCASLADIGYHAPAVTLPQIINKPRPWMDSDEIRRFVAAVHGKSVEIPALLGLLGLRRSEIAALTWDKVDLKRGIIRIEGAMVPNDNGEFVRREENKQAASRRRVPIMIPELATALEVVPEAERVGPVVKMHPNSIYKAVNSICRREGLPAVGVHGLRHSFASLGHHVGVPEAEMQQLGGWADAGTMRRIYQHIEAADKLKSENQIAVFFKNANKNAK